MTLPFRRIVYIAFIIIFLIITPIIILYTAGYRYNFQKHRIQKTGILILKSNPAGASIYLNGELKKEKTQARIANLLPDDYNLKYPLSASIYRNKINQNAYQSDDGYGDK